MATKPDKKPEWARVAEVDPVSGQNNYVEPSESKKDSGYTRAEIPPRQWINWLLKKCGEWIGYFEEVTDELILESGKFKVLRYLIQDLLYTEQKHDISGQSTNARGLFFANDGEKMYISDANPSPFEGFIYQYSLGTPYDVNTASYDSKFLETTSESDSPDQIVISPDGTKLFVIDFVGTIYQYTMSTPFDVSTASYDSVSLDVSTESIQATSFAISGDGTKLFFVGLAGDAIYQYSMTTSYDLSTASYDSVSLSVSSQTTDASGLDFSDDGKKAFVVETGVTPSVFQYNLTTAYDLSSGSYSGLSHEFQIFSQSREIQFGKDGVFMYVLEDDTDFVFQFTSSRVVGA